MVSLALTLLTLPLAAHSQSLDALAGSAADAAAQAALETVDPSNPLIISRAQVIARAGDLINNIRKRLDACGDKGMLSLSAQPERRAQAVPLRAPLNWNPQLADAAQHHASAMVNERFFDHEDPDGDTVGDRVSRVGYQWRQVGENLAAGHETLEAAVGGWLMSTGHCEIMIDDTYTEFGVARASSTNPTDNYGVYWALVVAKPR